MYILLYIYTLHNSTRTKQSNVIQLSPVLSMLGGQGTVQFLNDAARGQLWVKGPKVGGPSRCGDPAPQQGAMGVFGKREVPG